MAAAGMLGLGAGDGAGTGAGAGAGPSSPEIRTAIASTTGPIGAPTIERGSVRRVATCASAQQALQAAVEAGPEACNLIRKQGLQNAAKTSYTEVGGALCVGRVQG